MERGALLLKADKLILGHNADDLAETVLMNILRGDWFRLGTCVNIVTGSKETIERVRPFKYIYQKEIVLYAYLNKLD